MKLHEKNDKVKCLFSCAALLLFPVSVLNTSQTVDLQNIQSDLVCIRQQDIEISEEGSIRAKVMEIEFNGNNIVYKCKVDDLVLKISKANLYNNQLISVGDNIGLKIPTPAVKKLID